MFFERLKRIAARLIGRDGPLFGPPMDPYAGVREPRRRGPAGRQSGVAVMEPDPDKSVTAAGRSWPR